MYPEGHPSLAPALVHVCDVYDALRTRRPYRDAWSFEKTLGYLQERRGLEFDPALVAACTGMMRQWESPVAVLPDDQAAPPQTANPEPGGV